MLIQTELSELNLDRDLLVEKSPGENVRVRLDVLDERENQTIAFLKIDIADDANDDASDKTTKKVKHFCWYYSVRIYVRMMHVF